MICRCIVGLEGRNNLSKFFKMNKYFKIPKLDFDSKLIFYLIPINYLIDLFSGIYDRGSFLAYVRMVVCIFILFKIFIITRKKETNLPSLIIYLFLTYTFFQIFSSSNFLRSFQEFSKTAIILLMYPLGFNFFKSRKHDFSIILFSFRLLVLMTIINILVSTLLQFSVGSYSKNIILYSGSLFQNLWYTSAFAISILMVFVTRIKKIRFNNFELFILVANIVIIALSGRRTAWAILLLQIAIFLIIYPNKTRSVKYFITIMIGLLLTFPFYSNILEDLFLARQDQFEKGIESEYRYKETLVIWTKILSFESFNESMFGKELYNSAGNYGPDKEFRDRMIHVDVNTIVHGAGLFGLALYFLIYFFIFYEYRSIVSNLKYYNPSFLNLGFFNFTALFYTFLIPSFVISFSSGFAAVTFRSMCFLLFGSISGFLKRENYIQ